MSKKSILMPALAATLILFYSCEKEHIKTDKITFENLPLNAEGFWNGSDGSGGFSIGNAYFPNDYNSQYEFWSGFAYSGQTDTTTRGVTGQYSAIASGGALNSSQYAVLYSYSSDTIHFIVPEKITSISFCNSTYTYYNILEGDDFTLPFGGMDGNREDYFDLNLQALDHEKKVVMTGKITLADYRNDNNIPDWIGNTWTAVDLSQAGFINYLVFSFESSDVGDYGINTPSYVCIDNIIGELND